MLAEDEFRPCKAIRVDNELLQGDFRVRRTGYLDYYVTWVEGTDDFYAPDGYFFEKPFWGMPKQPVDALPLVGLSFDMVKKLGWKNCGEKVLRQHLHRLWKPIIVPEPIEIEDSPPLPFESQLPLLPLAEPLLVSDVSDPEHSDADIDDNASVESVASTEIDPEDDTQTIQVDDSLE